MNQNLSDREGEILRLAAGGATDKEICARLKIAMPTVRTHWGRIRNKLGVFNRSHAIAVVLENSLGSRTPTHCDTVTESLQREPLSFWVWNTTQGRAFLDLGARRTFGLPEDREALALDDLLERVWVPDRGRLRRFLLQSSQLRSMTPFECRVGEPGQFDRVVRTVTLTTHASPREGVAVLMASVLD
jgi:DNA-binding CsgD family transcriptional regulator